MLRKYTKKIFSKSNVCVAAFCVAILMLFIVFMPAHAAFASPIADGTFPGVGGASWTLYDDGTLLVYSGSINWNAIVSPWNTHRDDVYKIIFTGNDGAGNDGPNIAGTSLSSLFRDLPYVTLIEGLEHIDVGTVTNMSNMFRDTPQLTSIVDVSEWDTGAVTNMSAMFWGASSLTSLDLSEWDTGSVANMSNMFREASSLEILNLTGWDTGSVTAMNAMFFETSSLISIYGLSALDTGEVSRMDFMFSGASSLEILDLSDWNVSNVENMDGMFRDTSSLASLNVSSWDTGSVTNMHRMFRDASSLTSLDLSSWDTTAVTDMAWMFWDASSLENIEFGSGWDIRNVTTMSRMFQGTSSLMSLDLSGWDTGSVTSMSNMFLGATDLRQLTLGEDFEFIGGITVALTEASSLSPYTGLWVNQRTGEYMSNLVLMNTFDGSTMYGTWVWQRQFAIVLDPPYDHGFYDAIPHKVRVINIGSMPTGDLTIALSGSNADSFMLNMTTHSSLESGSYFTFTVVPAPGLPPGTHTAVVTVSTASIGVPQTFTVTFVVDDPGYVTIYFKAGDGGSFAGNVPMQTVTIQQGTLVSAVPTPIANPYRQFSHWERYGNEYSSDDILEMAFYKNAEFIAIWNILDMSIEKTADRTTARVGDTIVYTIAIRNLNETGTLNVYDFVVIDPLDTRLTFVPDTVRAAVYNSDSVQQSVAAFVYGHENGELRVTLKEKELPAGSYIVIKFDVTVAVNTAGQTIGNTVILEDANAEEIDRGTTYVTIRASGSGGRPGGGDNETTRPDLPELDVFTDDHISYLVGFPDGTIRPNNTITRAEVATIFFRLFDDSYRTQIWRQSNPFSDVVTTNWFNNAVSTLTNANILEGFPDGTFRGNQAITRAEFVAIIARFLDDTDYDGADRFNDISGHWAREYINVVGQYDWIRGFAGGDFRPNQNITRAEAAAIVNRMLNRLPESAEDLLPSMVTWPDNANQNAWFYLYIQEATNSHDFEMKADGVHERWIELREPRDWTVLEKPNSRP